jgi:seryl-tRNA synthetase
MRRNVEQRRSQANVEKIVDLHKESVELQAEAVKLRQQRNVAAEEMRVRGSKMTPEEKKKQVELGKQLKDRLAAVEKRLEEIEQELLPAGMALPNFTHPESPMPEEGPRIVKWVGEKPKCVPNLPSYHLDRCRF